MCSTGEGLEPPGAVKPAALETAAIAAMRTGNKFGAPIRTCAELCGLQDRCIAVYALRACLVAGDRFELPMLLAYETGVVTTLPAIVLELMKLTPRAGFEPTYF
jgi:hypothetical protein